VGKNVVVESGVGVGGESEGGGVGYGRPLRTIAHNIGNHKLK